MPSALIVEVQWGVIPGTVEGQRRWAFTRDQIGQGDSWKTLLADAYDEFNTRMDPAENNWTTMTWLWL